MDGAMSRARVLAIGDTHVGMKRTHNEDTFMLADEDNLRVIPGFDPWVEGFTRALWNGGEPVDKAWKRWSGKDGHCPEARSTT